MNAEQAFSIANTVALIAWLGLIFLPRVRWMTNLIAPVIVPALLAVAYAILIVRFFDASSFQDFMTLAGLQKLQATGGLWLTLAGWLHYLAFDLFVGAWITRTARNESIPHLAIIPSLLLAFMFGPFGLLVFIVTRYLYRKRLMVDRD